MKRILIPVILSIGMAASVYAACDADHPSECKAAEQPIILIVDSVYHPTLGDMLFLLACVVWGT